MLLRLAVRDQGNAEPVMPPLYLTLLCLIGSAVAIYLACEYFVNGVEWVGHRFAMGQKATGTLLAAFGTALPESVVTLVAVAFGAGPAQKDIGVGAALGGPLVLATVAYATVGWTMIACKRRLNTQASTIDFAGLSRDQAWFLCIFICKLALGLVAFAIKPWLGLLFLAAYAAYAWKETRGEAGDAEGELAPLKLAPRAAHPSATLAVVQTLAALAVVFVASRVFVGQIDALGGRLGLKPQSLALLLSPIATELPETLNAIIWIRQGKVRLALANISGAMMIQATVPTALGLFFTPWRLDPALIVAGAVTLAAVIALFVGFRGGRITRALLAGMILFYGVFLAIAVAWRLL
jgi:cation:H+ antiporter